MRDNDLCVCGELDDAKHLLLECPSHEGRRETLRNIITSKGTPCPPTPLNYLVTRDVFPIFKALSRKILQAKAKARLDTGRDADDADDNTTIRQADDV